MTPVTTVVGREEVGCVSPRFFFLPMGYREEVVLAKSTIESQLIGALEEIGAAHGIDIVDVEVVGATKAPTVRVRIDHADEEAEPISLDEVCAQNGWISDVVEDLDPFSGPYTLEVSSPGLARPLRRERDFVRFAGEAISLTTTATEGRKRFTGVLEGVRDGEVLLVCDGEEHAIALDQIKNCKLSPTIDFSDSSKKSQE